MNNKIECYFTQLTESSLQIRAKASELKAIVDNGGLKESKVSTSNAFEDEVVNTLNNKVDQMKSNLEFLKLSYFVNPNVNFNQIIESCKLLYQQNEQWKHNLYPQQHQQQHQQQQYHTAQININNNGYSADYNRQQQNTTNMNGNINYQNLTNISNMNLPIGTYNLPPKLVPSTTFNPNIPEAINMSSLNNGSYTPARNQNNNKPTTDFLLMTPPSPSKELLERYNLGGGGGNNQQSQQNQQLLQQPLAQPPITINQQRSFTPPEPIKFNLSISSSPPTNSSEGLLSTSDLSMSPPKMVYNTTSIFNIPKDTKEVSLNPTSSTTSLNTTSFTLDDISDLPDIPEISTKIPVISDKPTKTTTLPNTTLPTNPMPSSTIYSTYTIPNKPTSTPAPTPTPIPVPIPIATLTIITPIQPIQPIQPIPVSASIPISLGGNSTNSVVISQVTENEYASIENKIFTNQVPFDHLNKIIIQINQMINNKRTQDPSIDYITESEMKEKLDLASKSRSVLMLLVQLKRVASGKRGNDTVFIIK
ncbi:dynactin [Tieghemostelium lacteum]|uniref:Dynactin n=1 Tax=Tieghemostelium lacteum TaxID=361077 RepID=A0A151ZE04_TIELA|nr:dynactin [Tieghemostelium lacteum]|eukprot:KYQ92192.1 dynactin [Tieghemostelium lacteum]